MQTYLPYPDFEDSAHALDQKRLGKQRVENLQIMQALLGQRLITRERVFTGEVDEEGKPVFTTHFFPKEEWTLEPITNRGWLNHPVVKMWRGHEFVLLQYQKTICDEWTIECGFKDTCWEKTLYLYFHVADSNTDDELPPWLGDPAFHRSHQSNLLRKNHAYYEKQFPGIPDDLPYIYPS